jgi:hypothetical protein
MSGVQWGTVPDWLSMVGTVGAFAVVGALLWRETQRDRAVERDRERGQASRVIVQVDQPQVHDLVGVSFAPPQGVQTAVVANHSDLPIYGCVVVFVDRRTGRRLATRDLNVIAPHGIGRHLPPQELWSNDPGHVIVADAIFYDSAGRRWHRRFNGALRRLPAPWEGDRATRAGDADGGLGIFAQLGRARQKIRLVLARQAAGTRERDR